MQDEWHVLPYRRSGDKHATILRGADFMFLVLYCSIFPLSKALEIVFGEVDDDRIKVYDTIDGSPNLEDETVLNNLGVIFV